MNDNLHKCLSTVRDFLSEARKTAAAITQAHIDEFVKRFNAKPVPSEIDYAYWQGANESDVMSAFETDDVDGAMDELLRSIKKELGRIDDDRLRYLYSMIERSKATTLRDARKLYGFKPWD